MKKNQGITLVALIITIIILLILAGITINIVMGDNGILARTKVTAIETRGATVEEQADLWKADIEMSKHVGGAAESLDEILARLQKEKLLTQEEVNEIKREENTNKEITIGSRTISFKVEVTQQDNPNFTQVANSPDISKFNSEKTYYVAWDISNSPYKINEGTKISGIAPENWYDYTAGQNKWANVKTTGGGNDCYWVWIPRYAYKVPSKTAAETIEVKFLEGSTNNPIDKSSITINDDTTQGSWNVHPAFWFDKNNDGIRTQDEELAGIWVAKYEASSNLVSTINIENGTLTGDTSSLAGNGGGANTNLQVRVKPNVTSWRELNVNNIFTVCRNMTVAGNSLEGTTKLDSHMMKNIEWGAVAYLSSSKYGKTDASGNRVRVYNNPYYNNTTNNSTITGLAGKTATQANNGTTTDLYNYNTLEGTQASTTGNVYGIYDMAGGALEYTAAIYKGGVSNADRSELWNSENAKYVDQYTKTIGSQSTYYDNTDKYGDAVYETSKTGGSHNDSWDVSNAYFPSSYVPVFTRGGRATDGSNAGVFAFENYRGVAYNYGSFRPVVLSFQ